jgi:carboxyl-terminal processing protease
MLGRLPIRQALRSRRHWVAIGAALALIVLTFTWGFGDSLARAKTDRTGTYDLAAARMLNRALGLIRTSYVDPARVDPKAMAVSALERIQADVPEVRLEVRRGDNAAARTPLALVLTVGETTREFGLEKLTDTYELGWKLMDVFDFLERRLPPQIDLEAVEYTAINGVLATLDPHSLMLAPRVYREMQLSQKGRFGGLGIIVGAVDGSLVIQQVLRDSPASEAGLKDGDEIVQIGGESTINMGLDDAVNLLRGEPQSAVTLWIKSLGASAARAVTLVRREVIIPSVEEHPVGDGIGYVHVRVFQETTDEDLQVALAALDRQPGGLKGLIIDLRDNPGGLLDKAIAVSDTFLGHGTIVTTVRESGREREETHATEANTRADLPLVLLVNRGSASASEVVAGALKRNDRALVVGQRTFGKGSVQVVYKIDEAALKLTIAQYLGPGDVSIQGVGIAPDLELVTLRVPPAGIAQGLDLRPRLDETSEASLASHLLSDKTKEERASMTLRILEDPATPIQHRTRGDAWRADATVNLAKAILKAAPAPNRKQALVQLGNFLENRRREEEARLAQAFVPLGVDWKAGPSSTPPTAKVQASQLVARLEIGDGMALAGAVAEVALTFENKSRQALGRVHAELGSSIDGLDGREIAFGLVDAGKKLTRKLDVKLPPGLPAIGDRVTARFYVDGAPLEVVATADVELRPRPLARFAHSVQVIDQGGNGDGLVQRGETLKVIVWVTNIGDGPGDKVVGTLRNDSGPELFIRMGRAELGTLMPGETKTAAFELEVKPEIKARLIELGLDVEDQDALGATEARSSIVLAVAPDGGPKREIPTGGARRAVLGTVSTPVRAGANRDSAVIANGAAGATVAVTARVGDWLEVEWFDPAARMTRTGWVASDRARLVETDPAGEPSKDAIFARPTTEPPRLELGPVPFVTDLKELTLKGAAHFVGSGNERRIVYAFRGRDKILFRAAEAAHGGRDDVPFVTTVPLVPGRNEFVFWARDGSESQVRSSMIVYRK